MYTTWTDILAALTDSELLDILAPTDGYTDPMLEALAMQELELRQYAEHRSIDDGTFTYDSTLPDSDDLWLGRDDVRGYRKASKLQ